MNEEAKRIKATGRMLRNEYVVNEMIFGWLYAVAKLAIKLGIKVFAQNAETLDALITYGMKPSKLVMRGEYPQNPQRSE